MFRLEMISSALRRVKPHAGAIAGAVALVVLAAVLVPRLLFGPRIAVQSAVQKDFLETVVASGRVEAPHRVDIGVQVTGTVDTVPVEEGQFVAAGTVLVRLESAELRAAADQAELAVRQAEARLRQVREVDEPGAEQSVRQAQANYDVARETVRRNEDLFAKEFIGQAALDDSRRAEQVALAQLRTSQQQLAGSRHGGSNAAAAEAALAMARAAAEASQARLRYAVVQAPVAGTLIARDVEPGDVVQPGKALMVLSPAGASQLVVQVDEKNLKLLRLGQAALASADAYPEQRFAAQVVYINPGVDAQRGSVEVKLAVPDPPQYLRQDMTVSVDVEVARKASAVLVPTEAVHDSDGAAPWVIRVDGGRARRQAVRLGLRSKGWCEVLQGVRPGDQVVTATGIDAATLADGKRVRPVVTAAR